jgi:DNA-binding response OmpR family regulator
MRSLLSSTFHAEGYDVTEVADGGRLLVHIVSRQPGSGVDLVISDVRMPVSSGLQILKGLREAGWSLPFILLSAFADADTRAEAESLGATFFEKPLELETLRTTVRNLFQADRQSA